eukprot:gnl/Spiro4/11869_TR6266_c0_g1_i1.p2 gnl/Spiro4/11869_TR6266_c0_g1~~gnl/Spiro4/11869_TR6266_c0_g1_i1.p2  ORF type:complete len:162 (-),score=40.54 gnl/Spiro4/11869_TR6266_c0_g1_i1:122-607(-)
MKATLVVLVVLALFGCCWGATSDGAEGAAPGTIANAATAAILNTIAAATPAPGADAPANVPVPPFARAQGCPGCLAVLAAAVASGATPSGSAAFKAIQAACQNVAELYVPPCQYLEEQADFVFKRIAANEEPILTCIKLNMCDAGDAGVFSSSFSALREDF